MLKRQSTSFANMEMRNAKDIPIKKRNLLEFANSNGLREFIAISTDSRYLIVVVNMKTKEVRFYHNLIRAVEMMGMSENHSKLTDI